MYEVHSTKAIKTIPHDLLSKKTSTNKKDPRQIHKIDLDKQGIEDRNDRRSAMSEEGKQLKRNASENLRNIPSNNLNEIVV